MLLRPCIGLIRALFIIFPVVPLVDLLNILEKDFLTILLLPLSLLPSTSTFSAMSNKANKFSADLIVKLVLLPISASSAPCIDNGKFSAD